MRFMVFSRHFLPILPWDVLFIGMLHNFWTLPPIGITVCTEKCFWLCIKSETASEKAAYCLCFAATLFARYKREPCCQLPKQWYKWPSHNALFVERQASWSLSCFISFSLIGATCVALAVKTHLKAATSWSEGKNSLCWCLWTCGKNCHDELLWSYLTRVEAFMLLGFFSVTAAWCFVSWNIFESLWGGWTVQCFIVTNRCIFCWMWSWVTNILTYVERWHRFWLACIVSFVYKTFLDFQICLDYSLTQFQCRHLNVFNFCLILDRWP